MIFLNRDEKNISAFPENSVIGANIGANFVCFRRRADFRRPVLRPPQRLADLFSWPKDIVGGGARGGGTRGERGSVRSTPNLMQNDCE